jgi:hypothetical protein
MQDSLKLRWVAPDPKTSVKTNFTRCPKNTTGYFGKPSYEDLENFSPKDIAKALE